MKKIGGKMNKGQTNQNRKKTLIYMKPILFSIIQAKI